MLHPVLLEVGVSSCSCAHLNEVRAILPVGFEVLRLPAFKLPLDTLIRTAGGSTIGSASLPLCQAQCSGIKSDCIEFPQGSANDMFRDVLHELMYEMEWKAGEHQQAVVVPSTTCLAPNWHSASFSRPSLARPVELCQAASASTASMLEIITAAKLSGVKNLQAQARRCLLVEHCIASSFISTSSAAALAILNNLPYELPSITAHLCQSDQGRLGKDSTVSLGWQPSEHDMYGVAALGGVNFHPKLVYTYESHTGPSVATFMTSAQETTRFTCVVTGGLGGLGMLTAQWLSSSTPCALVLSSRLGLAQGTHKRIWEGEANLVTCAKCDVCFMEGTQALVSIASSQDQNFCGTVQAAGAQVCWC